MTDNIKMPPMPESYGYDGEDMEAYAREAVRLNAQAVPDGWPTDDDLTAIYKQANGEDVGKPQPLTTARIFKAMRAMLSAAPAAPQPAQQSVEDAVTWQELEAFRKRHWTHWNAIENLMIAHLVQTLRTKQLPAQQPLTDEQFQKIRRSLMQQSGWDGDGWDQALKEAIEQAHRIGVKP